jgi:hypothetical protein
MLNICAENFQNLEKLMSYAFFIMHVGKLMSYAFFFMHVGKLMAKLDLEHMHELNQRSN